MSELIEADLTWTGASFERGVRVAVGADGRIEAVGHELEGVARRLEHRALLPGAVNAHSHAFQRGLRGRGERFEEGSGSFWSWREAMYGLVGTMDAERIHALSLQAFREMRAAGITSVGEFHYLHHDASGRGYALDEAVLSAARDAGLRIVLLSAYYATGGIGQPLSEAQQRFRSTTPNEYWEGVERVARLVDGDRASIGCVVHSIRAASLEDLRTVHAESRRRGLVCHMHVEEQRKEIEDCVAAYARTPMAILNDELELDERFTAVHCTHTRAEDMARYLATGANVCVCPLTEANLGDGIPRAIDADTRMSLGTDSNARISMVEEMRLLEYGQRLASETRGALRDEGGQVARRAFLAATEGGARSLGIEAGVMRAGALADFLTLDLEASELAGWTEDTLLDAWVFGGGNASVAETCVGGRWG